MTEPIILEGMISVRAALEGGQRPIHRLLLQEGKRDIEITQLERTARQRGVEVERVSADVISSHATGRTHGGILAVVGPRTYLEVEQLLAATPHPFFVMLDGVEDPYNFGYAIRSLYAAGADGLIVRPREWMAAEGIVVKASAGTAELMPTAVVQSPEDAAEIFKRRGIAVACTARRRATSIYSADLSVPLFLLIGGERRGITRQFLSQADLVLEIPYQRRFQHSMGTVSATSVLAFEIMRQRMAAGNERLSDRQS